MEQEYVAWSCQVSVFQRNVYVFINFSLVLKTKSSIQSYPKLRKNTAQIDLFLQMPLSMLQQNQRNATERVARRLKMGRQKVKVNEVTINDIQLLFSCCPAANKCPFSNAAADGNGSEVQNDDEPRNDAAYEPDDDESSSAKGF